MDAEYRGCDSPRSFYFNGVELPKWAASWCVCNLLGRSKALMENWDERIGWSDLWILYCRIDHVGVIESEDPLRFCICAGVLLEVLIPNEYSIVSELVHFAESEGTTSHEIFSGVRDGLMQMLELATRDGLSFWTTGYENDRIALMDTIRRYRLPTDHPEYLEAPHVRSDKREALRRLDMLRENLFHLAFKWNLSKDATARIQTLAQWSP